MTMMMMTHTHVYGRCDRTKAQNTVAIIAVVVEDVVELDFMVLKT